MFKKFAPKAKVHPTAIKNQTIHHLIYNGWAMLFHAYDKAPEFNEGTLMEMAAEDREYMVKEIQIARENGKMEMKPRRLDLTNQEMNLYATMIGVASSHPEIFGDVFHTVEQYRDKMFLGVSLTSMAFEDRKLRMGYLFVIGAKVSDQLVPISMYLHKVDQEEVDDMVTKRFK